MAGDGTICDDCGDTIYGLVAEPAPGTHLCLRCNQARVDDGIKGVPDTRPDFETAKALQVAYEAAKGAE